MNLINQVVADGKQVLVMVPEISLTPQMMSLFLNQYGSRVAVLHSALSMGERMDEWKRIKRGDAQIVVGTRSAVFAPCSRLGLIVMDESRNTPINPSPRPGITLGRWQSSAAPAMAPCCCSPPPRRRWKATMRRWRAATACAA